MNAENRLAPVLARESLRRLASAFAEAGEQINLVGGSVRDALLGVPDEDIDLTTSAIPDRIIEIAERTSPAAVYRIGEKFGTIGLLYPHGDKIEITTYRGESYTPGSRKPEVVFGTSLVDDLARRDFTINAIAVDLQTGRVIDPFDGRRHLDEGALVAVGNPVDRFTEDPLRMLRAVRFSARGWQIAPETRQGIVACSDQLAIVSAERIGAECEKILTTSHPDRGLAVLAATPLLAQALPELVPLRDMSGGAVRQKNVWLHTLQVVRQAEARPDVRWAALLHDAGKAQTRKEENGEVHFLEHERVGARLARTMLTRLRFPTARIQRIALLVEMHMTRYAPSWTDSAVRRFMLDAGDTREDLFALLEADVTSRHEERHAAIRQGVRELRERCERELERQSLDQLQSPLDGTALMALFQRPPGPWIRPIKDHLRQQVIDGVLAHDDKEGAERIARELLVGAAAS